MQTVVKFMKNKKNGRNKLISRTLLKIGFIDRLYKGDYPKEGEFWLVDIKKDINPGNLKGCFILEPVKKLIIKDISKLIPGMYTEHKDENGVLHIYPISDKLKYPIILLDYKKTLKDCNAVIVHLPEELKLNGVSNGKEDSLRITSSGIIS